MLKMKTGDRDIAATLKLAGVEGSAKALAIPQLNADVTMTGPDLPNKRVQIPITGSLRADLEKQTMNADLASKFDESNIQAKLGLAKFSPPSYLFDVNVDKLNLDRYTGDEQKAANAPKPQAPSEGKAPEKPAPSQKQAEDSPVDLSFLKGLNANGKLQVRRAAGERPQARQREGRGEGGQRSARYRAAFGQPVRGIGRGRDRGAGRRPRGGEGEPERRRRSGRCCATSRRRTSSKARATSRST